MIIAVSGVARSGKDTFFSLLKSQSKNYQLKIKRLAFADQIKKDLRPLVKRKFNIDILNPTAIEKELVRPLLVAYGTDLGRKMDKNFWIKVIEPQLQKNESKGIISVITDTRYPNEQEFLKNKFKDSCCVHVSRHGFKPINSEEEAYTPSLERNSDYVINWSSFEGDHSKGLPFIQGFINEKIKRK